MGNHSAAEAAFKRAVAERDRLTGREIRFPEEAVIVSKTDPLGVIRYANKTFLDVAGYSEAELIGAPHSILRHNQMPRCVFQFLWDTLSAKREIFAYVRNRAKNGDHYDVLAHVTPTFGTDGEVIGYHSSRRCPRPEAMAKILPIYQALCAEEAKHASRADAVRAGTALLLSTIASTGLSYEELIHTL